MQFRERRRVIQVIRTTYDPELKRGRSEVVGKIDKAAPAVTEKLQKNCTPEELAEVDSYLAHRQDTLRTEAVRAGAETLPTQIRQAAEYFRTHRDDEALIFAAEIREAWDELKAAMRKSGFSKSKVLKRVAKPARAVTETVAEEPATDDATASGGAVSEAAVIAPVEPDPVPAPEAAAAPGPAVEPDVPAQPDTPPARPARRGKRAAADAGVTATDAPPPAG